jgi:predicted ArsR family transcriptional regulator
MREEIDLQRIEPAFHAPARVAILAMLVEGDEVEFVLMAKRLGLTNGNLASHLRKLEEAGYIRCLKTFIGRRPNTTYRILSKGRAAFERYVVELEKIIGAARKR